MSLNEFCFDDNRVKIKSTPPSSSFIHDSAADMNIQYVYSIIEHPGTRCTYSHSCPELAAGR